MISRLSLFLLIFLCSYSFLKAQDLAGKTVQELENFIVTADKKSRIIHIYDKEKKPQGVISIKNLSLSKKRIKELTFVHSELGFAQMPINQFSSFYENKTHLIFSFSEEEGKFTKQKLFFFDKLSRQISWQVRDYRIIPEEKRRCSGAFLLDSLYYAFNIFPKRAVLDIQSLYDKRPDQYLASFEYPKDQLPLPSNIPILKDAMTYSLAKPDRNVELPKPKKQQKLFNQLLREGSRETGGATVKVEYFKEDYLLITIGAQVQAETDAPNMIGGGLRSYNFFHFQLVLDKHTFEPVSNEVLKEREVIK